MIDKIKQLLSPEASVGAKLTVISLFLGKAFESAEGRLVDLEARQLQKGDKGDPGVEGKPGKDGKQGPRGEKGIQGPIGLTGSEGKQGKTGQKGKDGVSVVDSEVAADGHLVLKLSNGSIIDAGPLPEPEGSNSSVFVSGNSYQITVSATAPSGPQLNDLWLDIT